MILNESRNVTVKQFIIENELKSFSERLDNLIKMNAPDIVVNGQKKAVDELKSGNLKIGGDTDALGFIVKDFENKKGNGGKPYITIKTSNGDVNYYPAAKFGRYIKKA